MVTTCLSAHSLLSFCSSLSPLQACFPLSSFAVPEKRENVKRKCQHVSFNECFVCFLQPFGVNQPGPYVMYTTTDSNGNLKNASGKVYIFIIISLYIYIFIYSSACRPVGPQKCSNCPRWLKFDMAVKCAGVKLCVCVHAYWQ